MSIEIIGNEKDLPNDVRTHDQLTLLPEKYLSSDPKRPLLLTTSQGEKFTYALRPLLYSVLAILIIECCERMAYYSINTTEQNYLTGRFSPNWNANMSENSASEFLSSGNALTYTVPLLGGILADGVFGDYWSITLGVAIFYIPGLILTWLTTFPDLLGTTFNTNVVRAGALILIPVGSGLIKCCVNVFGGKQYHPILQANQVEQYYVLFYVAINVGAMFATLVVPVLAEFSMEAAYAIPVFGFIIGLAVFLAFSKRYVNRPPERKALFGTLKLIGNTTIHCKSLNKSKQSNGGPIPDSFVDGVKRLLIVAPVSALTLPFQIAYNQMSTIFVSQGNAMRTVATVFNSSFMSNFDCIGVLVAGAIVGSLLYPALEKRGIRLSLATKISIGTFSGALSMLMAIIIQSKIHHAYLEEDGAKISILWQILSYSFIGIGEVFAVSTCYEAAFTIAPKEQKAFASAIQLFVTGGLSNYICMGLLKVFESWFPDKDNKNVTEAWVGSGMTKYFWVLFGIMIFGTILTLIPSVRNWLERLRENAIEANALSESSTGKDEDEIKSETNESVEELGEEDIVQIDVEELDKELVEIIVN